ncbi:hypothetical protein [Variovorax sp. GB1P17]|uniref:hypothetical protein n=1 Tax=Variovorax sp. GB1P17 TaxID=3443740 RepID=UPI003F44A255
MPSRHSSFDLTAPASGEPTEWTSNAPQVTERTPQSASDWVAWLIALAVLAFFAVFGFRAMTWALAGGWQWLWMVIGLPVFATFSVLTVMFVVKRLREGRRVRVALENMSLERGEGFRVGEPLELRLRATVPRARAGERTVAPERIVMRLIRRAAGGAASGEEMLPDECCDEAVAHRDDARADRLVYACELCASPAYSGGAAQWSVELHDPAADDDLPFFVAGLRLLPER